MTREQEDWEAMSITAVTFDPAALAAKAQRFDRQIRARNWREYAASLLVVLFFGWRAINAAGPAQLIGALLIIAAAIYVAVHIWKAGTPDRPDETVPTAVRIDHLRRELDRQAHLLENVRTTYLAPFVPGFLLLAAAPMIDRPGSVGLSGALVALATLLLVTAIIWAIDWLNRKAARDLRARIAALD